MSARNEALNRILRSTELGRDGNARVRGQLLSMLKGAYTAGQNHVVGQEWEYAWRGHGRLIEAPARPDRVTVAQFAANGYTHVRRPIISWQEVKPGA